MKEATQERWRTHVEGWVASGLSCREYAARAGVNPRTLTWWKSKLGPTREPRFVEVTQDVAQTEIDDASTIELRVGAVEVRVRGLVDTEALARVLDVREGRR